MYNVQKSPGYRMTFPLINGDLDSPIGNPQEGLVRHLPIPATLPSAPPDQKGTQAEKVIRKQRFVAASFAPAMENNHKPA